MFSFCKQSGECSDYSSTTLYQISYLDTFIAISKYILYVSIIPIVYMEYTIFNMLQHAVHTSMFAFLKLSFVIFHFSYSDCLYVITQKTSYMIYVSTSTCQLLYYTVKRIIMYNYLHVW